MKTLLSGDAQRNFWINRSREASPPVRGNARATLGRRQRERVREENEMKEKIEGK